MKDQLQFLFDRLVAPPEEWFIDLDQAGTPKLQCVDCNSYQELLDTWKASKLRWTDANDIAFSCMLATCASVKIRSDQVFLRVLGIAGTVKTTLSEGLSVNRDYTKPMSAQRGFHSGMAGGKDCSLIPLMKDKTIIINEGDMLLKSPNCTQILSEIRDIWSGVTRADYRNGVSYEHEGLKTNFIIAGTPALRELNESTAGDRFLDVVIYERDSASQERLLVQDILRNSLDDFSEESNGSVDSTESPERTLAKQKTGGFVGYLRANIKFKLKGIVENLKKSKTLVSDMESLGLIVAKMRTRPALKGENKTESELHVRLTKQITKLAISLAVVLDKPAVDEEVMRRVAHVAEDTSYGNTFFICKALYHQPLDLQQLVGRLKLSFTGGPRPDDGIKRAISTLISLEAVRAEQGTSAGGAKGRNVVYTLSQQQRQLMEKLYRLMKVAKVPYA